MGKLTYQNFHHIDVNLFPYFYLRFILNAIIRMLLFFSALVCADQVVAATFSIEQFGIVINGKIERGDYRRFQDFLLEGENIWKLGSV